MYCNSRDVRRGNAEASRKVTLGLADWQFSLLCQASPLSAFAQAVTDCVGGCIEILKRTMIGLQSHIWTHLVLLQLQACLWKTVTELSCSEIIVECAERRGGECKTGRRVTPGPADKFCSLHPVAGLASLHFSNLIYRCSAAMFLSRSPHNYQYLFRRIDCSGPAGLAD